MADIVQLAEPIFWSPYTFMALMAATFIVTENILMGGLASTALLFVAVTEGVMDPWVLWFLLPGLVLVCCGIMVQAARWQKKS